MRKVKGRIKMPVQFSEEHVEGTTTCATGWAYAQLLAPSSGKRIKEGNVYGVVHKCQLIADTEKCHETADSCVNFPEFLSAGG